MCIRDRVKLLQQSDLPGLYTSLSTTVKTMSPLLRNDWDICCSATALQGDNTNAPELKSDLAVFVSDFVERRYEKFIELGFPTFARGFKVDMGKDYKMPNFSSPRAYLKRLVRQMKNKYDAQMGSVNRQMGVDMTLQDKILKGPELGPWWFSGPGNFEIGCPEKNAIEWYPPKSNR